MVSLYHSLYAISLSIEGEDLNLRNPIAHRIYMRVKSNAWLPIIISTWLTEHPQSL